MLASTNEFQFQETSTSGQSLFKTNNMENNTDDECINDSHDDHFSSLDDLIASNLQEFDSYGDPHTYSHKDHALTLLEGLYK
jgi:hypothetical protein